MTTRTPRRPASVRATGLVPPLTLCLVILWPLRTCAQTPDLPLAALPFSNVLVSTQIDPDGILVGGNLRPTQGIVMGAAEIEINGFGNLCFVTDRPSIGATSGLGTDEFTITGTEMCFAGADLKCCPPDLFLATCFGITDAAIGTMTGGAYAEFALPGPPLWAAGVGSCSEDIKIFGLCVVTANNNLVCVTDGVKDTYPIPSPLVAPPFTYTNGPVAGVLLITTDRVMLVSGGNVSHHMYPGGGGFIGYSIGDSVSVLTGGGLLTVPLPPGANTQEFGSKEAARIDFNLFGCPDIGAVNLGWNPGGLQCPPIVVVEPGGPLRGHGQGQPQVAADEDADDPNNGGTKKAMQDTVVIANWSFDNGAACDASGWTSAEIIAGDPSCSNTDLDPTCLGPIGLWARLFKPVTDNDICANNGTCSWLFTDNTTPTMFNDISMSFGPGGFIIKNWLDNVITSPWVSLSNTATATQTLLSFQSFPGNSFRTSRIVDNVSVRSRSSSTPTQPGQWRRTEYWSSLGSFRWQERMIDLTPFVETGADEIQVRYRVADWQEIAGASAPNGFNPGPGPYFDRARIGRRILSGPVISPGRDTRRQAQDAFPTGPDFAPTTDRFGHCAFSAAGDLDVAGSFAAVKIEDAISIDVLGSRIGGEEITSVTLYCAIVAGPHAGKGPPPYTPGANGFFAITASPEIDPLGTSSVGAHYVADMDDEYFRGGDVVHYVWIVTDNGGGLTSYPPGLTGSPASIAAAHAATNGLLEVSFLPAIDWDAGYLARVAADPHGKLEPTAQELQQSAQKNCILYVQKGNAARRASDAHRTSFMYALDRLGYRGHYDVYDLQAVGYTNNDLASRATVQQLGGYNLVVHETGHREVENLPTGADLVTDKVDQAGFYRAYLAQAAASEAQFATLWMLGSNIVQEKGANALLATDMGVVLGAGNQSTDATPDVVGVADFTFDQGLVSAAATFTGDSFAVFGACPTVENYDGLSTSGGAVLTHRYGNAPVQGRGAIVMNRNNAGNWNTILQSHPWGDIRDDAGAPETAAPELALLTKILGGALPPSCLQSPHPVDSDDADEIDVPRQTALHQNSPNPFNPTTVIRFDLAQKGNLQLQIFDVSGRRVRTLLDETREPGRHQVTWNGLDATGNRVASGIYLYRLVAGDYTATRKMVVMK